jgi:hypothetical protein
MFLSPFCPYLYLVERRDMSIVVTAEHHQPTYNKNQTQRMKPDQVDTTEPTETDSDSPEQLAVKQPRSDVLTGVTQRVQPVERASLVQRRRIVHRPVSVWSADNPSKDAPARLTSCSHYETLNTTRSKTPLSR